MTMTARFWTACGFLAMLVAPVVAQPADKPQPQRPTIPANGTEIFRELVGIEGLKPLASIDEFHALNDPAKVVIVLQNHRGASEALHDPASLVRHVLEKGGAVFMTVGSPIELNDYFPERTRLRATEERVFCPEPDLCYDGNGWQVFPQAKLGLMGGGQELFLGVTRLMTSTPITLHPRRYSKYANTVLATYPPGCLIGGPNGPPLETGDRAFAIAGAGDADESFRCLVVGDPSVIQNYPIAKSGGGPESTQNLHFAFRTVRWLKGTGEHKRTHCLYLENGVVRPKFQELGLFSTAMPNLPTPQLPENFFAKVQAMLTDMANESLSKLQDRDVANHALAGSDRRFSRTLRFLAVLAAIVSAVWLMNRLRRSRHTPEIPQKPRDNPLGASSSAPVGTVAARRAELVDSRNLTEPLRDFLRELFAERGLPSVRVGDPMPPVTVSGRNSRELRQELTQVWKKMFGPKATVITPDVWKELEPMIESIRRAAEAGRFTFTPAEGSV